MRECHDHRRNIRSSRTGDNSRAYSIVSVPKLGHLIHNLIKCREDIIGELDFGNGRPTRGGVTDCHTLERKCKTMKNIEADVVSRGV